MACDRADAWTVLRTQRECLLQQKRKTRSGAGRRHLCLLLAENCTDAQPVRIWQQERSLQREISQCLQWLWCMEVC